MTISVSIRHRFGGFAVDVEFSCTGGLIALFGASGSGKTSLLRLIAGMVRPDEGRIAVKDHVLVDTARGIRVPAHRRHIGFVFQEPRLFPHLSVRHNLEYGRWFARHRNASINTDHVVEMLGIGALLDRPIGVLSGGEAQRVAIGRALLSQPDLLLMDEPLAAIDDLRKAEILPYFERLRDELRIPIVYVSHALDEIVRLATTLVVLDDGRVAASGALDDVLSRINLPLLARRADAGVVLDAEVADHDAHWQLTRMHCQAGTLLVPRVDLPVGTRRRLWVRARDVSLATERPLSTSIVNVLDARVVGLAGGEGASMDVQLDCNGAPLLARITRLSADRLGLQPGSKVYALVKGIALRGS